MRYTGSAMLSVLLAALMLSGCGSSQPVPIETTPAAVSSETVPSEEITVSETILSVTGAVLSETVRSELAASVTETKDSEETASDTDETSGASVSSVTDPAGESDSSRTESQSSSEASFSEDDLTEITLSPALTTQTTLSVQTETAAPKAEVVIPDIRTGCFTGKNVIGNDMVSIDISDTSDGVISVNYMGEKKIKVRIACGDGKYDYDYTIGGSGNIYPLQMGNGTYTIQVYENTSGKSYAVIFSGEFDVSLKDSFRPFTLPSQFIMYDRESDCVYKAAELCAGKKDTIEKIAAIFGYITDNVKYDKALASSVKSGYIPDPDSTLASNKGICFDYASLFAAMCRSQGIPTRLAMGYVSGNVYHAWNEVYTEKTGWITVDIFLGQKGYNLVDTTFYASASSREQVIEFIGNGSNYAAVLYY
ncbi:MAG: transglutaminase domain-containing protein [Huintestinicola sp.]